MTPTIRKKTNKQSNKSIKIQFITYNHHKSIIFSPQHSLFYLPSASLYFAIALSISTRLTLYFFSPKSTIISRVLISSPQAINSFFGGIYECFIYPNSVNLINLCCNFIVSFFFSINPNESIDLKKCPILNAHLH